MTTPHENAQRLAAESLAEGDSTGWFERLYAAAEAGETAVPWSRDVPNPLLVDWASARWSGDDTPDRSRRAVVVGCGLGTDAEYVGGLGFDTVAFDVSPSAVRAAQRRFPDSPVRYVAADLLHPPADWRHAYHLVVESITVQSLPTSLRQDAVRNVADLVAPGGTLIVLSRILEPDADPEDGPPWLLTRTDVDSFTRYGLDPVRIEQLPAADPSAPGWWRAEFHRP